METVTQNTVIYKSGRWEAGNDQIVIERPVSLVVNNEFWITFMCTPIDLEALALGFLFNEEIINTGQDVANIRVCPSEDNIDVWLNHQVRKPDKWIRTSGCSGGETSIELKNPSYVRTDPVNGVMLSPKIVEVLMEELIKSQDLYRSSGGIHTSALCDGESIISIAEDIGRHNTLDKLAGKLLLEPTQPENRIILTTGRISSEMIHKANRMKASMVISRTSPTSLSVKLAEEAGITLIGYARYQRFTIYAYPERIMTSGRIEQVVSEAK